jgi:SAM-dependent methyltransferase
LNGRRRRLLHFAPEPCLERRLRRTPGLECRTADLEPGRADLREDITALSFRDRSFDIVLCSHVLEHVPDDRRALAELRRVIALDGTVLLAVPIRGATTDEDPTVVDAVERLRRFGQSDHVRFYGADFAQRVQSAGFDVREVVPADIADREERDHQGVPADGVLYVATPRCV